MLRSCKWALILESTACSIMILSWSGLCCILEFLKMVEWRENNMLTGE